MRFLAVLALLAAPARADTRSDALLKTMEPSFGSSSTSGKLPKLALVHTETKLAIDKPLFDVMFVSWDPLHPITAFSADGKVGWLAVGIYDTVICGMGDCDKVRRDARREAERKPPYHLTALVDGDQPIFIHFGPTGNGVGEGEPITTQIDDDAKPVAELFGKSIGDPAALAATVSARSDAALIGTAPTESFVGGTAVRATLAKWGLAFKVVGGVRAGTTKSKTIAWVLAEVEASSKTSKKTTYRLSAIYEKTGGDWKLVQLHFS
jgi:hypothetical protein